MLSACFDKFKSFILKLMVFNRQVVDEESLFLNEKIDPSLATGNFNYFLSIYGLDISGLSSKRRNKFMLILFIFGFTKLIIFLNLDPIKNYKICFFLGDFTLLFKSLRTFLLIFVVLLISFNIQTNYLFNYNSNLKWIEVFKCFDGNVVPQSIGIRDKKILKKMLMLTKTLMKSVLFNNLAFSLLVILSAIYLFTDNLRSFNVSELVTVLFWFPLVMLDIFCLGGTTFTSTACFQIICYYCLLNYKYYNDHMRKYMTKFKNETTNNFVISRLIRWNIKKTFLQQNYFSIRIMKYNQFWSSFYLIMMFNFVPAHIIVTQQALFGYYISVQLRIMFMICAWFGSIFIILSSLHVCQLVNQIKVHQKHLIQFQFEPNLKLDIKTKIKVRITFTNKINCNFIISDIKHN